MLYLPNIETDFELWKVAKPGTLKNEKPICMKTSRNKNQSKSWKQLNNNIILEWQPKWKHTASVKHCWFLYTAKNLIQFPVINDFQYKRNQIIWIANNFQKFREKVFFPRTSLFTLCLYRLFDVYNSQLS